MSARNHTIDTIHSDVTVVGGGIVGLATAMTWQRHHPGQRVTVLEAESAIAQHQSGHNSGVIHSGIYYRPGSEKAVLCRRGKSLLEQFCQENGVFYDRCGKVVVATNAAELASLDSICERAEQNGVEFRRINTDQLREREPAAAGIAAIEVPETGIVDYRQVCRAIRQRIEDAGGQVLTGQQVQRIDCDDGKVSLDCASGPGAAPQQINRFLSDSAICCGGLHSDRLFRMADGRNQQDEQRSMQIVPFRGEYYELKPERRGLCRHLIYPVPNPSFPFLGVHFTRMVDGNVECGPNAVLAFSRAGYRWRDIDLGDLVESLKYRGFRKLAGCHWRMGLQEMHRSVSKAAFVKGLQRLIPSIRGRDLVPARAGVRAQAVAPDGSLVDDFSFAQIPRMTHVLNAPSPAATASLAIAEKICQQHVQLNG